MRNYRIIHGLIILLLPMEICASGLKLNAIKISEEIEKCGKVTLSVEEREILVRILKRDDFMVALAKAEKGLATLNTVLKIAAPGPISLVFSWNQGTIKGWRIANKKLDEIGRLVSCDDIALAQTLDKYESCFWENLSKARGCEE